MRRDELLLLTDRGQETERVWAEADHPDRRDREKAENASERDPQLPAALRGGEDEEGEEQARRELHPDPGRERQRGRPRARAESISVRRALRNALSAASRRAQSECQGEQCEQHRVVVRPADREHEQHRVQAEEGRREGGRSSEPLGRPGGQPDREQAAERDQRFDRPERPRHPQRGGRVAREREERAVGGVLEGPADEGEHGIG